MLYNSGIVCYYALASLHELSFRIKPDITGIFSA